MAGGGKGYPLAFGHEIARRMGTVRMAVRIRLAIISYTPERGCSDESTHQSPVRPVAAFRRYR